MIPPPPCFTVGWLQSSINSSPAILLTYTLPSLLCKRSLDSSLKMTWDHCSAVQSLWVRANSRQACLCHDVRRGFFLGFRPMSPASFGLLWVVDVDTHTMLKLHLSLYLWNNLTALKAGNKCLQLTQIVGEALKLMELIALEEELAKTTVMQALTSSNFWTKF